MSNHKIVLGTIGEEDKFIKTGIVLHNDNKMVIHQLHHLI